MKPTALVVGGTLAGLTAALRLNQGGYAVTLIEHAEQVDGVHAPLASWETTTPPVLMGYQAATLALLDTLGTAHHVSHTHRIGLELIRSHSTPVRLRYAPLPAPLHVLAGLAFFRGMPARDRWRFLMWVERTWEQDPPLPIDLDSHTAEVWLRGIGQSEYARTQVWTPLSRFLLGDDIARVSAGSLLTMLMRAFLSSRRHSQLLIPVLSTDRLLTTPLRDTLVSRGVAIKPDPIDRLDVDRQHVVGLQMREGGRLTADRYIVALPHRRITPLLPERLLTRFAYFQQIAELSDTPAVAVRLEMDRPIRSPRLVLLAGRTFHWMCFTTAGATHHTVAACMLTGASGLKETDEELVKRAAEDVHHVVPDFSDVPASAPRVVRTPHAFLSMKPGMTTHRPLQTSPVPNLLLAGEWTDTGLPSGVESAVVSGNRCAQAILEKESTPPM